MSTAHRLIIHSSVHFLEWNLQRIARCLSELTEAQCWQRPNGSSNSVGNQLLHLDGNITQWLLNGLGSQPDRRQRDAEFSATGGFSKVQLLEQLKQTTGKCTTLLEQLTEEDLVPERPVQAYVHDGYFILQHVVEHLSYHTGQIIFWTKLLTDRDLQLYGTDDLSLTN